MKQQDFKIDVVSSNLVKDPKMTILTNGKNANPNFYRTFGEIHDGNNKFFYFKSDKVKIEKGKSYSYNLIYFPLIRGLEILDKKLKRTGKIENEELIMLPLMININNTDQMNKTILHHCETNTEKAGASTCAGSLVQGSPEFILKDITEFKLPLYFNKNEGTGDFTGAFYFLPVLLSNMSICYLATKDKAAVLAYVNKANSFTDKGIEYFIAINNQVHPIDEWSTFICFFKYNEAQNQLLGVDIVDTPNPIS
jgi:hypothetical protein